MAFKNVATSLLITTIIMFVSVEVGQAHELPRKIGHEHEHYYEHHHENVHALPQHHHDHAHQPEPAHPHHELLPIQGQVASGGSHPHEHEHGYGHHHENEHAYPQHHEHAHQPKPTHPHHELLPIQGQVVSEGSHPHEHEHGYGHHHETEHAYPQHHHEHAHQPEPAHSHPELLPVQGQVVSGGSHPHEHDIELEKAYEECHQNCLKHLGSESSPGMAEGQCQWICRDNVNRGYNQKVQSASVKPPCTGNNSH